MRLSEDRFYRKYPCILITAKGQPDVATRLFLRRLKMELNIPVLGLVDSDPYGRTPSPCVAPLIQPPWSLPRPQDSIGVHEWFEGDVV